MKSTCVANVLYASRAEHHGGKKMANTVRAYREALSEVRTAAHAQDLVEVHKRARIDREADGKSKSETPSEEKKEAE